MSGSSVDKEQAAVVATSTPPARNSLWTHLSADVEPKYCTAPLSAFCFMTGYIDAISFSAIFVWCGFQTGNFAQLALALARLWEYDEEGHRKSEFHMPDQQALCSLLTFMFGAMVLGRFGDHVGPKKRVWLAFGTFVQALLTMASALCIWASKQGSIADDRGNPSWNNTLTFLGIGFMSASLGVQGIMGKRITSQFGTTIVLTTIWCELVSDPSLFRLRQRIISRDHRLIAAFTLFLGAFMGRAVLASIGAAGALGVGAGIRVLIALSWVFVKGKQ